MSLDRYRRLRYGIPEPLKIREPSEKEVRIAALSSWFSGRWYPVTRRQISDAFPDLYDRANAATDRMFYRDMRALLDAGLIYRIGNLKASNTKFIRADRAKALADS